MCAPNNTIRKQAAVGTYIEIGSDMEIEPIRDTQDVPAGANRLSFFPPNASQSEVRSNYSSVPLPGGYSRAITSISINATVGAIRSTDLAAVDPYAILNALRECLVKVTADNGTTVLLREPLRKFMNLSKSKVDATIAADATDTVATTIEQHVLNLQEGGYYDLDQGFEIAAGQTFSVDLIFEDGSAFPDPAAYQGKALALEVDMKAAVPSANNG